MFCRTRHVTYWPRDVHARALLAKQHALSDHHKHSLPVLGHGAREYSCYHPQIGRLVCMPMRRSLFVRALTRCNFLLCGARSVPPSPRCRIGPTSHKQGAHRRTRVCVNVCVCVWLRACVGGCRSTPRALIWGFTGLDICVNSIAQQMAQSVCAIMQINLNNYQKTHTRSFGDTQIRRHQIMRWPQGWWRALTAIRL